MANKYQPIWDALKKDGHVKLAIPKPLHDRVWKGLINLKDRDPGFKLLAEDRKKRYRLDMDSEQSMVRIFLREFDDLKNLTVADL